MDPSVAESAISQLLPTLVGGMASNAKDTHGADALTSALASHQGTRENRKTVKNIDAADGDKIVNHVFGSKKDDVIKAVSSTNGFGQDIIAKILPIVAPIVLAWAARRTPRRKELNDPAALFAQDRTPLFGGGGNPSQFGFGGLRRR